MSVITDRVLNPHRMSPEELERDWRIGEEESENRRRLAAEALDRVPASRRIFPAAQIVGPIFRNSEYELPRTPIWEMWRELLASASDIERVGQAHPAFAGIISQLSSEEAEVMRIVYRHQPLEHLSYVQHVWHEGAVTIHEFSHLPRWEKTFEDKPNFAVGISNLKRLELIRTSVSGRRDVPKFEGSDSMVATSTVTCHLTQWGMVFMMAVSAQAS